MNNPIKEIVAFNKKAGLLDKGYDDFLESSFQIEEALEGFDLNTFEEYYEELIDKPLGYSAKDISRLIVRDAMNSGNSELTDIDRLDKAVDAIVYAVGSCAKLGLTAQQITKAINIVVQANNAKLNMPKDEYGKLMKPEGFVGPEVQLQKILDERV